MSGTVHQLPFKHYHRKEDGSVYFSMWGQLTSAPDETPRFGEPIDAGCKFDMENAIPVKEWESGEVPPLREVETVLGLPITLTPLEKVRDAINAMKCEWHSDYDYPDFLSVYPAGAAARSPAADDDGVAWSFGLDIRGATQRSVPVGEKVWVGNDRNTQNTVTFPYSEKADPAFMAGVIVKHMRETALERIGWLNTFINSCVSHIEQTSGTSPRSIVGPWAGLSGGEAYDEARSIIATWEGRRA